MLESRHRHLCRRIGILTTLWALQFLISGSSHALQDSFSAESRKLVDEVVEQQMSRQQLIGVCVGVIREGRVVYTCGYGHEDRESSTPASTQSMFRWASISKPVTAVAAMQLVEQGKLNLDDDVRKYVPEFPDKGELIRVRDLMCHQSGIVHYTNGKVIRSKKEYDVENPFESVLLALDTFRESPLVHVPRERYSYSTHAYILLSAVVERAGEARFHNQVQDRVCRPLGLKTLQPDYQWREIPNRATGYRLSRVSKKPVESSSSDVSWKLGGGGFISSIDDLAGFAAGLMSDKIISDESRALMWTAQELNNGEMTQVGLGFFVGNRRGRQMISHNGAQEKTRTRMVIFPESGSGYVVMTNSENANCGQLTTALIRTLED